MYSDYEIIIENVYLSTLKIFALIVGRYCFHTNTRPMHEFHVTLTTCGNKIFMSINCFIYAFVRWNQVCLKLVLKWQFFLLKIWVLFSSSCHEVLPSNPLAPTMGSCIQNQKRKELECETLGALKQFCFLSINGLNVTNRQLYRLHVLKAHKINLKSSNCHFLRFLAQWMRKFSIRIRPIYCYR